MSNYEILKETWCQVWFDEESESVNVNWEGYLTYAQITEGCNAVLNYVRLNSVSLLFCNQLSMKILNEKSKDFLSKKWLGALEDLGIEKMALLTALDPFAKACMNQVIEKYEGSNSMSFFTFGLEKDFLNWLKKEQEGKTTEEDVESKISAYQLLRVDDEVKLLDPLGLDHDLGLIRDYNKEGRTEQLVSLLFSKLPLPEALNSYDYYTALAAMRDIGILLGSIKKAGVEPLSVIPELEYVLHELSRITELPARETLMHYTIWNPDGERMRTYTHYKDERSLIQSVKNAFPALDSCIDLLLQLHHTPFESSKFEEICDQTTRKFKYVVEAIVLAYREVSPEIFAKELRFYFDPIKVGEEELIGPGAVEMPMFVFDHLLWSSMVLDEEYVKFKKTYLKFNMGFMQEIYDKYDGWDSLLDKMVIKLSREGSNDQVLRSAKSLMKLCNSQKSFRKPHKKLADKSYEHQDETGKDKGSGGYSTDILSYIYSINLEKIGELENALDQFVEIKVIK
ncbi:monodechloroaminopyrrolnitrin synthase PrnB family protein [Reichenbachiella versicolor]|uniref:monodechloroaminopyrrolnitrin synthase PrnB family protein n=1 Tax=Reichenbachiella versicolor TaxID=1821036 RepID=UPI000D6E3103|nr:monodechloroaminopyrrolnitrin synthase PrnB family protein [Reichenbachiella versicolor]